MLPAEFLRGVRGVGVDVCEVARVAAVVRRFGARFVRRVLTPHEQAERDWLNPLSAGALARRWALKEAVGKALGTGIGAQVGFQQIQIGHTAAGAPTCVVAGMAGQWLVSVSDEAGLALALAVWQPEAM
jgi:holo-[acyl-carrier protein] synthase